MKNTPLSRNPNPSLQTKRRADDQKHLHSGHGANHKPEQWRPGLERGKDRNGPMMGHIKQSEVERFMRSLHLPTINSRRSLPYTLAVMLLLSGCKGKTAEQAATTTQDTRGEIQRVLGDVEESNAYWNYDIDRANMRRITLREYLGRTNSGKDYFHMVVPKNDDWVQSGDVGDWILSVDLGKEGENLRMHKMDGSEVELIRRYAQGKQWKKLATLLQEIETADGMGKVDQDGTGWLYDSKFTTGDLETLAPNTAATMQQAIRAFDRAKSAAVTEAEAGADRESKEEEIATEVVGEDRELTRKVLTLLRAMKVEAKAPPAVGGKEANVEFKHGDNKKVYTLILKEGWTGWDIIVTDADGAEVYAATDYGDLDTGEDAKEIIAALEGKKPEPGNKAGDKKEKTEKKVTAPPAYALGEIEATRKLDDIINLNAISLTGEIYDSIGKYEVKYLGHALLPKEEPGITQSLPEMIRPEESPPGRWHFALVHMDEIENGVTRKKPLILVFDPDRPTSAVGLSRITDTEAASLAGDDKAARHDRIETLVGRDLYIARNADLGQVLTYKWISTKAWFKGKIAPAMNGVRQNTAK